MKITKLAFLFVGLVAASASVPGHSTVPYHLRDSPDPSIIARDTRYEDGTYANGLVDVSNDNIVLAFQGDEPNFINYLYHLTKSNEDLIVKDATQHQTFVNTMENKIREYENDRVKYYGKALKSHNDLVARRNSVLTRAGALFGHHDPEIDRLQTIHDGNMKQLELIDRKLLKLKAFQDYCTSARHIIPQSEALKKVEAAHQTEAHGNTIMGKAANFFGWNKENRNENVPKANPSDKKSIK